MTAPSAREGVVAMRAGWSMPPAAGILVLAVVGSGFTAARLAASPLWIITPIVASVIVFASARRRLTPGDLDPGPLPPPLRRAVNAAAAELPTGEARDLLAAVVRQARAIFAADDQRFTPDAATTLRRNVADLVDACCTTALDLARLDAFLAPGAPTPPSVTARAELDARGRAARVLVARRLTDAELALRSLYTAGVERGTPTSDRVAELVTEIQADAAARRTASDELRRLLGATA